MLRALVAAGFVEPERGPRRAWRFSFRDLIVLRAAQSLVAANVPRRRIVRALTELRRQLPASLPLSGLSIGAVGDRVVVREGTQRWQAESGQYLLAFDVEPASVATPPPSVAAAVTQAADLDDAFNSALDLEEAGDIDGAIVAYGRVIDADAAYLDAHLNRALLLQAKGRAEEAERAYRDGLAACGEASALLYNQALFFEDTGHDELALASYQRAVDADPGFADAHHNLALLYDKLGRTREALRHLARYRQLTR